MARTVEDVIEEVVRVMGTDASYTPLDILKLMNEGMLKTAGMILPDGTEVWLPALEVNYDVTTDTSNPYVALPTISRYGYHKNLRKVYSDDQDRNVTIYKSIDHLHRLYPGLDESGNVSACAIGGVNLYYQPTPSSADTLTLYYFAKPEVLDFTDEIDQLEEHAVIPLLSSYCLYKMYGEMERKAKQPSQISNEYRNMWIAEMAEMMNLLGPYAEVPHEIDDTWGRTYW